ncbi:MAG: hypothetical protein IT204_25240 [Fimbriimonadaceae bacterium]|nr:hypothetical protein [Fimbriimonadaceae bacterium]
MHHGADAQTMGAVLGIALIIMVAGVVVAVLSHRAGQYKDPEAAKFEVTGDEEYPTAEAGPRAG